MLLLRIGLGLTLLYASVDTWLHPDDWVGYVPNFVSEQVDATLFVRMFATVQFALVVWLAIGAYLWLAGLILTAALSGILLTNLGVLEITFRDIGLAFAALAMAALDRQQVNPGLTKVKK